MFIILIYNEQSQARLNALQIIVNDIKQRIPADVPVFLMGDFNTDETGDLRDILQEAQLNNTKHKALECNSSSITHTSWGSGRSSYIDHVFAANLPQTSTIAKHEVIQNTYPIEPSDHNPVVISVTL